MRLILAGLAAALFASACASSGAVPRPYPGSRPVVSPSATVAAGSGTELGVAVAEEALSLQGLPYQNGGTAPSGFDCSGFVQYVLARKGVPAPRSVREQVLTGRPVGREEIRAGDLVFFAIDGREVTHVGIATGPDTFVHAPSSRGSVRVDRLGADYWRTRFAGARRLTDED